ncbi:hypothetical protein HanPSC8_Chr17g0791231 [Helianthus annuus]|nr:hypothetical protein HanPSC8_Chr17g0791231 [Helianthus annuus]
MLKICPSIPTKGKTMLVVGVFIIHTFHVDDRIVDPYTLVCDKLIYFLCFDLGVLGFFSLMF